jgi:hypothetical protein
LLYSTPHFSTKITVHTSLTDKVTPKSEHEPRRPARNPPHRHCEFYR